MLPKKVEGKKSPILKCRECGHEKKMGSSYYKVEQRIKHSPRDKVVVIEEEIQRNEELTEDERRERRKAILEHYEAEE
jgi:DNA-directed RNA polymerase subunit M/transcription elongation factor TFIIS